MFKSIKKIKKQIQENKDHRLQREKEKEIQKENENKKINLLAQNISQVKQYFLDYCPCLLNEELKAIFQSKQFFNQYHFILYDSQSQISYKKQQIIPFDHRLLSNILVHYHPSTFQIAEIENRQQIQPYLLKYYEQLYEYSIFQYFKMVLNTQINFTRMFLCRIQQKLQQICLSVFTIKQVIAIQELKKEVKMAKIAKSILQKDRDDKEQEKKKKETVCESVQVPKQPINMYEGYRNYKISKCGKQIRKKNKKLHKIIQMHMEDTVQGQNVNKQ